jgi:hypothetical protein
MRLVLLVLLVGACSVVASAQPPDYIESFDYPNGFFPPGWSSTGDPQGGGQFLVSSEEFVHVDGGYVYYVADGWFLLSPGSFTFRVRGPYWEFAWGITPGNEASGWCMRLRYDDSGGAWGCTLTETHWSTIPGFPGGRYMFHHGADLTTYHYAVALGTGWHSVNIEHISRYVTVYVDSQALFHVQPTYVGGSGFMGLGASTGSGSMSPAFDDLSHWPEGDPVHSGSWGGIKALFR